MAAVRPAVEDSNAVDELTAKFMEVVRTAKADVAIAAKEPDRAAAPPGEESTPAQNFAMMQLMTQLYQPIPEDPQAISELGLSIAKAWSKFNREMRAGDWPWTQIFSFYQSHMLYAVNPIADFWNELSEMINPETQHLVILGDNSWVAAMFFAETLLPTRSIDLYAFFNEPRAEGVVQFVKGDYNDPEVFARCLIRDMRKPVLVMPWLAYCECECKGSNCHKSPFNYKLLEQHPEIELIIYLGRPSVAESGGEDLGHYLLKSGAWTPQMGSESPWDIRGKRPGDPDEPYQLACFFVRRV